MAAALAVVSAAARNGTSPALTMNDLLHQTVRTIGLSSLQATVNANVQDSTVKLLTNPRIRVRNHEKAKILIGERVPNFTSTATSTGFLSQSVNYLDIGLTLNVEPTVYLDDTVGIKLALEVSSLGNTITTTTGTAAYQIGTRTASTVLQLKNGETDVLAGLIDNEERTSGNKLPGLGQLPGCSAACSAPLTTRPRTPRSCWRSRRIWCAIFAGPTRISPTSPPAPKPACAA